MGLVSLWGPPLPSGNGLSSQFTNDGSFSKGNTRKLKLSFANNDDDIKATANGGVDEELADAGGSERGKSTTSLIFDEVILKIPPLTVIYWCEKMTATTFGETFADYFTQTLDFGYATTSIVLIAVFAIFLAFQLKV